jgi:hypothetical protein
MVNRRIAAMIAVFNVYTSSIVECHQSEWEIMRMMDPIKDAILFEVISIKTKYMSCTVRDPNRAESSTR